MTIDPQILEFLREDFKMMAHADSNPYPGAALDIRKELASMGLDLNDDATYELLQPGLTKQTFDDLEFLGMTYGITRYFHELQSPLDRSHAAAAKYQAASDLLDSLAQHMPALQSRKLPQGTDPYHAMVLKMLMDHYASGQLQDYRDSLAVSSAQEHYAELQESLKDVTAFLGEDGNPDIIEWDFIFYRFGMIKKLTEDMDQAHRADFFRRISSDATNLDKLHRETALVFAREIIKNPYPLMFDEPDTRYSDIVKIFKDAGIDIQDAATYDSIGIDPQTFWDNYKKEEEALKATRPRPRKPFSWDP